MPNRFAPFAHSENRPRRVPSEWTVRGKQAQVIALHIVLAGFALRRRPTPELGSKHEDCTPDLSTL
jgi:hypothetical protein